MSDTRPIGVFDSGVGGLTAVKELHRILPAEHIIYFGDTGRVPYGTRSAKTVRRYASEIISYLARCDVKAILAACGTVSANFSQEAYDALGLEVPYFTVVDPAARKAAEKTNNGRIGVIATTSSIRSSSYTKALQAIDPEFSVYGQACPLLVPLVENGLIQRDNQITRLTLEMYLEPLQQENIDTLILGCTHFPLLADIISDVMGPEVALVDSGASAVGELSKQIRKNDEKITGTTRYCVTDTVEHFVSTASVFLEEDIQNSVHYIDPEEISPCNK